MCHMSKVRAITATEAKFESDIPTMPFESIAADYFDFGGRHYLGIVDRLSNWIEVFVTGSSRINAVECQKSI